MANERREDVPAEGEPDSRTRSSERILEEQELVNERESAPKDFGGMATPPVETAEPAAPARSGEQEPMKEGDTVHKRRDIQSEGE